MDTANNMTTLATVAQVIIALVAIYLAGKANYLNKEAHFLQRIISELFEILTLARKVKASYLRMFDPFDSLDDKRTARTAWLQAREAVEERLVEIHHMFPEVDGALQAWKGLEEVEDTHAMSDVLTIGNQSMGDATTKYSRSHRAFLAKVGTLMKTIRK
jgi:hypothetical protein